MQHKGGAPHHNQKLQCVEQISLLINCVPNNYIILPWQINGHFKVQLQVASQSNSITYLLPLAHSGLTVGGGGRSEKGQRKSHSKALQLSFIHSNCRRPTPVTGKVSSHHQRPYNYSRSSSSDCGSPNPVTKCHSTATCSSYC